MDLSVSLNGLSAAAETMNRAARRIASPKAETDFAAEFVAVDQARIAAEANLAFISMQHDLERETIDLFA